ncbi:hypothetical protein ACGF4C_18455 [Streptomyces sp. NPDC048197]|uniref:hypothetical protein n=1 Tax=Streptomyces sp. NPDC048197 TaxID=3365511 RepID=UPI003723E671
MTIQTRPADTTRRTLIRDTLGLRHLPAPRPWLDETDTRIVVWSIRELDAIHLTRAAW